MQFQDFIVDNPYKCHFDRLVPVFNVGQTDNCFAKAQKLKKNES